MNIHNKALIELMTLVPKSLYKVLDMRRETTKGEEEKLREYLLVNLCLAISKIEIDIILKLAKDKF